MKRFTKVQWLVWLLAVLPLLLVGLVYSRLPRQVPMHWGFDGTVSYSDKWQLLLVAALPVALAVMFLLLPVLDPRRSSYETFRNVYELFQIAMMLLLLAVVLICVVEAFRPGTVNVPTVVGLLCSMLFILIGLILPKCRPNFFFGLKTPWTLSSETVWTRTHRLSGRLMLAAGMVSLPAAFVPDSRMKMLLLMIPLWIACIVPTICSYLWFRQEQS